MQRKSTGAGLVCLPGKGISLILGLILAAGGSGCGNGSSSISPPPERPHQGIVLQVVCPGEPTATVLTQLQPRLGQPHGGRDPCETRRDDSRDGTGRPGRRVGDPFSNSALLGGGGSTATCTQFHRFDGPLSRLARSAEHLQGSSFEVEGTDVRPAFAGRGSPVLLPERSVGGGPASPGLPHAVPS